MTIDKIYFSLKNGTVINQKISKSILETILMDQSFNLTITELSKRATCSQPSVTRYVRHLKYKNYKTFIDSLNEELMMRDLENKDNYTLTKVRGEIIKSVYYSLKNISDAEVTLIAQLINKSRKINITWIGGNYYVFVEMQHKLSQIGKNVMIAVDWHQQLINLNYMDANDLILAISYSGSKYETNFVIKNARAKGIPVVLFTGNFNSPLKEKANYVVNIISSDPKNRSFSFAAKPAMLAVWQLIFKEILSLQNLSDQVVEAWRWQLVH